MTTTTEAATKTCTTCGKTKLLTAYSVGRGYKDGRRTRCKTCCNAYQRECRATATARQQARSRQPAPPDVPKPVGLQRAERPQPTGHWSDRSACYGMDPALFETSRDAATAHAKAACARCPVRRECLDEELAMNRSGDAQMHTYYRGGTTPIQRAKLNGRA